MPRAPPAEPPPEEIGGCATPPLPPAAAEAGEDRSYGTAVSRLRFFLMHAECSNVAVAPVYDVTV